MNQAELEQEFTRWIKELSEKYHQTDEDILSALLGVVKGIVVK
jgi:hypothetical protein